MSNPTTEDSGTWLRILIIIVALPLLLPLLMMVFMMSMMGMMGWRRFGLDRRNVAAVGNRHDVSGSPRTARDRLRPISGSYS